MALTETDKKTDRKEKPLNKIVVRRLPPSMDQESFLKLVSPIPEYSYICTAKGDSSLGEMNFTRIYINFINSNDVFDFKERFDNYVFLDNKGQEYPAVVEYAPFQKIPKRRGRTRMDPKCGTIESDTVFQEFVKSLDQPKEQDEKMEYTLQLTSENKTVVITPLLEYIKNKRAQKMKYKDMKKQEDKGDYIRKKDSSDDYHKDFQTSSGTKGEFAKDQKNSYGRQYETEDRYDKSKNSHEKSFYKNRSKKFDTKFEERTYGGKKRDIKPGYVKKDNYDNQDYKKTAGVLKKDDKISKKKVKKYSEKREERKLEVQKSKVDVPVVNPEEKTNSNNSSEVSNSETVKAEKKESDVGLEDTPKKKPESSEKPEKSQGSTSSSKPTNQSKTKESESQHQKRIRNKDRPTIAIYRPGMLSKMKQHDTTENKEE